MYLVYISFDSGIKYLIKSRNKDALYCIPSVAAIFSQIFHRFFCTTYQNLNVKRSITRCISRYVTKHITRCVTRYIIRYITSYLTRRLTKYITSYLTRPLTWYAIKYTTKNVTRYVTRYIKVLEKVIKYH